MAVIDQYFKYLVESGGSDLHLSEGQPPKNPCQRYHFRHF